MTRKSKASLTAGAGARDSQETGAGCDGSHAGRPMTGFFALLTPEQRRAALAYRGPDALGPGACDDDPAA